MNSAITNEVIRHALLSAADEMARNLCRTAYNTVVYEIHDYGIGVHDVRGDVVADSPGIAVFTRGNDYGIKKVVEFLGPDAMGPGDIFMLNYPYWASAHSLDVLVFGPIHDADKQLIGYASCRVHVVDLMAKSAGYVLDSVDMYEEGIFFPGVRIYRGGEPCEDIFNIVRFNSRIPDKTIGDIQAQASAVFAGVRRVSAIAEKHGSAALLEAMDAISAHGERLARMGLAKLPKGTWTGVDYVDHDGMNLDTLIKLQATVTITDDEFIVDWRGSAENVPGPINLPFGETQAITSLVFKGLTTPDTPVVAGNFAPLKILTTEGSVMHAVPPMPTFTLWTGLIAPEVILKALAQGMPELIPACSGGDVGSMMGLGINPRSGDHWLEATNEAVGFGGHARGDGEDGIMHLSEPGCRNNPVEVLETKAPMLIDHYGFRPDSCGAGKYRGGVGVSRTYRFTAPSTAICLVFKTKTAPWGVAGGKEARPNRMTIHRADGEVFDSSGKYNSVQAGDVLVNDMGGGGGYGDPFEREPAAVAKDVRNGYIGVETALKDYGVAVDPETFAVDEVATRNLRASA
ncbi:MAG: hydantoinase B/oxoprolinase family protein [Propionibacteriaceae bacterium]|jgi:N-methylhydantoinase B|nr:hydantoinase B/oxoprolinase family protein [Propionibacteriaceae bacterium]